MKWRNGVVLAWKVQLENNPFFSTCQFWSLRGTTATPLLLLELPGFLVAAVADPHRVVPAARWHRPPPLRAVATYTLATGAAVMDGEARGELSLALVTGMDVLVGDPVGWAGCVFNQAWKHRRMPPLLICTRGYLFNAVGSEAHPEVCRSHQLQLLTCSARPPRPFWLSGCLHPPLKQHPTTLQHAI